MTAPTRPVPVTGGDPAVPESDAEALARLRRENAALKGQLLALASSALTIQPSREKAAPRRRLAGLMGQVLVLATGVALGIAWSKLAGPTARGTRPALRGALPAGGDSLAGDVVRQASELEALSREFEPGR